MIESCFHLFFTWAQIVERPYWLGVTSILLAVALLARFAFEGLVGLANSPVHHERAERTDTVDAVLFLLHRVVFLVYRYYGNA